MQKLRLNKPLTASDLAELERLLQESGAEPGAVERARADGKGLGVFIRSLVGLDRKAATKAFSTFLVGADYNARQLDFVNLIIGDLTENGVMEPVRLFESPFTDSAPQGPQSLFGQDDVQQIVSILRGVNANAGDARAVAESA